MMKWKKYFFVAMILLSFFAVFTLPSFYIYNFSDDKIYKKNTIESPLSEPIAIVFGAAVYSSGPSPIYADRLTVAANLYKSGMVRKILVSGDNATENYNEPQAGKDFLVQKGVKENDIITDHAGFRSYDTCMRAKKIFSIDRAIVVTQEFHLPRVVFLCESSGISTIGVSADMRKYANMKKNYTREFFAQQKAFYDVFFTAYRPKFLGEQEPIIE